MSSHQFWHDAFSTNRFYYGFDAGTVARRAVRYASADITQRGAALDCGCGEGQDLAFLAECGFAATGLDFTASGIAKAQRLLASRNLQAQTHQADLQTFDFANYEARFSLVLCVNALQFLGADAPRVLQNVARCVAPGGVLGISIFAPGGSNAQSDNIWLCSVEDLIAQLAPAFAPVESAALSQWYDGIPQPFATLIARRI